MSFRRENLIKNTIQTFRLDRVGIHLVGFELRIDLPELLAHLLQIVSALLAHGDDFVDASFGVVPTKSMEKDVRLASIITDECANQECW